MESNVNRSNLLNEMQELQMVQQTEAHANEIQLRASSYEMIRDENFPKKGMNTSNPN